jgi:O-antigen ligase
MFSKSPLVGLYGFLKLLEFVFLGFYTAFNIKKLRLSTVLALFSIGIIFESFLSILQYFHQGSIGGIFYFFGERTFNGQTPGIANASINGELVLRPYGTFSHPNVLAGFLVIAMTLILSGIKNYESRIKRIVFILTLTIGTIALFLTLGRIAIVVWVLILGFFIVRKFLIHNSYFLILLIVVFLFLGLTTPLGVRFTDIRLTDESIVVRQELIKSSLLMVKNNPFFGVGLNNFLIELPDYQKIKNYFTDLQPVHNIFLLVAAQTGIVGLIFFLWFIGKTYKRIMNHESRIRHRTPIIHNSKFIILSTALVLGFFDHYFLTLQQGQLLFSFILGFCWSKSKANVI